MNLTDMENLAKEFEAAYTALSRTCDHVASVEEELIVSKLLLTQAKDNVILAAGDPKSLGANEAAREATIRQRVDTETAAVIEDEQRLRAARSDMRQRELQVECLRAILRCAEVAASLRRDGAGQ